MEKQGWTGDAYDYLEQNCCHFSDALALALGVGSIPLWVLNLAKAGSVVRRATKYAEECCRWRGDRRSAPGAGLQAAPLVDAGAELAMPAARGCRYLSASPALLRPPPGQMIV